MPSRWVIDRGFTIAANETQQWLWEWWDDAAPGSPSGPNKGPVVFRAVPKGADGGGNNATETRLVTFDFAKGRLAQNDPRGAGHPKVFYEFKVRNESDVDLPLVLEMLIFDDLPTNLG